MDFLCRILSIPAVVLAKVPGLGPCVKLCSTSVGQKVLMAFTGLSLCGFLVVHLSGNLLLFKGEAAFNEYAEKLHSLGPVLAAAETGLFAMFLGHIGLALSTTAMSRRARRIEYAEKQSKQDAQTIPGGGASNWMLATGLLIGLFLVVHITDMKLGMNPLVDYPAVDSGSEDTNKYGTVRAALSAVTVSVYFLGVFALGIHLMHGIASAFQTFGINNQRWNGLIRCFSIVFGWAIAAGYMSILLWSIATDH